MPATTETILGVFAHVDTTVRALEELKAKGYHDLTVYTPVPIHEIEDVVERDRPVSKVRLFTLLGGLTGLASGWILTAWTSLKWGLIVGGKPPIGLPVSPPYVVIMFEMMILFGGIATLIGMVTLGRLPRFATSPSYDRRFSNDRFGVAVHCAPERAASVREILGTAGAEEVRG
jgi:molybdopterin-containing oxidoreductase family membrane subunit